MLKDRVQVSGSEPIKIYFVDEEDPGVYDLNDLVIHSAMIENVPSVEEDETYVDFAEIHLADDLHAVVDGVEISGDEVGRRFSAFILKAIVSYVESHKAEDTKPTEKDATDVTDVTDDEVTVQEA